MHAWSPLWLHHIFVQINKKTKSAYLAEKLPNFVDLFALNFLSFYPTRFLFFVSQLWLEKKSDVAESMQHAKWPKPCPRTQVWRRTWLPRVSFWFVVVCGELAQCMGTTDAFLRSLQNSQTRKCTKFLTSIATDLVMNKCWFVQIALFWEKFMKL